MMTLLIPAIIAGFALSVAISHHLGVEPRFSRGRYSSALLLTATTLLFTLNLNTYWVSFLILAVVFSFALLFIPARFQPSRHIATLALMAGVAALIPGLGQFGWLNDRFRILTGEATYRLIHTLFPSVSLVYTAGWTQLSHPDFTLSIGGPCSGLSGTILFSFIFLVMLLVDRSRFEGRWYGLFFSGLGIAFFANVLRLVALHALSIPASRLGIDSVWTRWLFHDVMGFAVQVGALGLFLKSLYTNSLERIPHPG